MAHTACPLCLSGMSWWLPVTLSPYRLGLFQAIKLKELSCCPILPSHCLPGEPGGVGTVPCPLPAASLFTRSLFVT